MILEQTVR